MFKNEETKPEMTIEEKIAAAEAQLVELKQQQAKKLEAEKEAAKVSRKEEAEVVKTAISNRLEGEAAAKKAKAEAYKTYLAACDDADAKVDELRKVESAKLKEFCDKHPEGFHESIKLGDLTYNCNYSTNAVNYVDPFKKLWETFWF